MTASYKDCSRLHATLVGGDRSGGHIHCRRCGVYRWYEHFEEQFSWPRISLVGQTTKTVDPWNLSIDPPTDVKVELSIRLLSREKAACLGKLPGVIFKLREESLITALIFLLCGNWNGEFIPLS